MTKDEVKLAMQVLISLALLVAGLVILLTQSGSADLQKAATGWIGILVGYWLK